MAQAFDMRRLHMGCGESLRPHLPLSVYGNRLQTVATQIEKERDLASVTDAKKATPEERR
jgi:hypothetical protein